MNLIDVGIPKTLNAIAALAWHKRLEPAVHMRARRLTDHGIDRQDKIRLLVDELHRRFVYAPDPVKESVGPLLFSEAGRYVMDADDACLFLAAFAMSVGIPCRIVGARYWERCWTCCVAYEDEEGRWTGIDPLRQETDQSCEELIFTEMIPK